MRKSPRVMVLLANISLKENTGGNVGDPNSPLPLPSISEGRNAKETAGYPKFLLPGKIKEFESCSFLVHQAFLF